MEFDEGADFVMNVVKLDKENAKDVATLMHRMKPERWPTFEETYGQLTNNVLALMTTECSN